MKVQCGNRILQGTGAGKMPSYPRQHITWAAAPSHPSPAEQGTRELGKTPLNQHSSVEVKFLCPAETDEPKWQHRCVDPWRE